VHLVHTRTAMQSIQLRTTTLRPNCSAMPHLDSPAAPSTIIPSPMHATPTMPWRSIVKLVERFYLPTSGRVLLDDQDAGAYNYKWLKRRIALVKGGAVSRPQSCMQGRG
jgi:hypothetical protein